MTKWITPFIILFIVSTAAQANADTLIVGYTSAPPFIIENSDPISGVNIWLWEKIAADLNRPFQFVSLPFDKLMTSLADGSIDICINPLTLTSARAESFHFTSPFFVSNSTAVIKDSHGSQIQAMFYNFFSYEFIAGITILFILIALFGSLTWFFERKENPGQFRNSKKGIWDGLWWSAVTVTTVGYGDKAPKSRGGKIVALIWMFTALLFISGLTASIASTIMSTNSNNMYSSIDDLRSLDVGTIENTATKNYLESRFFKNINSYSSVTEGLDALETGSIKAFVYDEPIMTYRLNERDNHHLNMIPLKFNLQLYGFGVTSERIELLPELSERILHYTNSLEWPVMLREYSLEEL